MAPKEQGYQTSQYQHNPSISKAEDSSTANGLFSQKRRFLFRLGVLRFGVHGCFGILSTILVSYALYLVNFSESSSSNNKSELSTQQLLPLWLSVSIVFCTLVLAIGSYGILSQVPKSTKISWFIIPPHREAFKRTVAIAGYLNLRFMHQMGWFQPIFDCVQEVLIKFDIFSNLCEAASHDGGLLNNQQHCGEVAFPIGMFLYDMYHFFPRNANFKNGNTWVFIIPMWLGFNCDTFHQFPSIEMNETLGSSPSLSWDRVVEWNSNVVDVPYLLLTLFCTIQVAFMFTLAFRNYVHIQVCYWVAAAVVFALCVRLQY